MLLEQITLENFGIYKDQNVFNFNSTEEKEKWYSNKANVNMLNKKQAEYFKDK